MEIKNSSPYSNKNMLHLEQIEKTIWSLIDGPDDWWQWGIIAGCVLLAVITRLAVHKIFEQTETKFEQVLIRHVRARKGTRSLPIFFCLYLWLFQSVLATKEVNCAYIYTIAVLVSAYCIYKLAVSFSKGQIMPKFIGLGVLTLFILQQIGWLEPLKSVLTSIYFDVGNIRVDIFKIASAIVALFILVWLVGILTRLLDNVVQTRKEIPRVLKNPAPRCLLIGFGDSSIDLQIRFWINDANDGVANVRSQVLLEIWKAFRDNGIAIPFPQREITIKHSSSEDNPGVG
jgi:hypothetical protein